jgi:hypothetical protein
LRRRLAGPEAQFDFPVLAELAAHGATDYIAELVGPGTEDASRGDAVAYSFATDRSDGFSDDDIATLRAVLPAVSLAMRAYLERVHGIVIPAAQPIWVISRLSPTRLTCSSSWSVAATSEVPCWLTSNRAVGEWGSVLGDPVVATAILDRLLHHSHVLTIRGDSYRLREKRRSGLLQKTTATAQAAPA